MRCVLPSRGPELALSLGVALCLAIAPPAGAATRPVLPPVDLLASMAVLLLEIRQKDGWSAFTVRKPAAKAAAPARPSSASPAFSSILPPQRDILRVGVGLGAVAGADWGGEITGAGAVRGFDTSLAANFTSGPLGTDLLSGHASLDDPESGWGGEAGDLASPLWGYARGFRLSRRRSGSVESDPLGLSLYLPNRRAANRGTVLAWQGDLPLGSIAAVGGEIASDGSWFGRARVRARGLGLHGYYRDSSGRYPGTAAGLAGSLDLPGGLHLQGGASRGGSGDRFVETRNLSLSIPAGRAALTLESTGSESRFSRSSVHAAMVALPLGHAHALARLQRRDGELRAGSGRGFAWRQDEALLSLAGPAGGSLRWNLQLAGNRPWEGRQQTWGQLHLSWWITDSTSLHLLAADGTFPGSGVYSLRVEHLLQPGLLLSADYGDVPTFQPGEPDGGDRLRLTVRKTWDLETPAAGAVVTGRVKDSSQRSPGSVAVQLGPYRTVTDADGRYAFRNLPGGGYELRVLEEALPAGYIAPEDPHPVAVARGQRLHRDLAVVELGTAAGWVYVDRNSNRRRDPGEGIAGVVLLLGDRATASGPDGSFGFHNVAPGAHRLRLDTGRLPEGLAATIPSTIDLGLPPGGSLDSVELRLAEKRRPVVFQELRP